MGYLDGDTIAVDAILTKKGRQLLSNGGNLNISSFTLSDTGIDYTLWNADHPSGSAYYGEAIENLPMVEASVHPQYYLRNKLISLGKDTVAMPVLELSPNTPTPFLLTTMKPQKFTATLVGYSGTGGCQLLIQDVNVVKSLDGTTTDITGNALSFISEQQIPNAALYELGTAAVSGLATQTASDDTMSFTFTIQPQTISDASGATTNLTFISTATGASVTIEVKVSQNKDLRRTITSAQG